MVHLFGCAAYQRRGAFAHQQSGHHAKASQRPLEAERVVTIGKLMEFHIAFLTIAFQRFAFGGEYVVVLHSYRLGVKALAHGLQLTDMCGGEFVFLVEPIEDNIFRQREIEILAVAFEGVVAESHLGL